jgi:uncharacterized protein
MPAHNLLSPSPAHPHLSNRLAWFCPPTRWTYDLHRSRLQIEPDAPTDFWQRTHYGFQADNGHFLFTEEPADFTLRVFVQFRPQHQYDQAGLMVRLSPDCWLKTSIEFEPGRPSRLGAVVTNHGYSDWSTQDFDPARDTVHFRVARTGDDYLIESSVDGDVWTQLRIAPLLERRPDHHVQCGLYACSPKAPGFTATFSDLILAP